MTLLEFTITPLLQKVEGRYYVNVNWAPSNPELERVTNYGVDQEIGPGTDYAEVEDVITAFDAEAKQACFAVVDERFPGFYSLTE